MSRIEVINHVIGRGPRVFGVNVEVQDHAKHSNLWDFLADCGVSCVRTFHPEKSMRRHAAVPGELGEFASWADFEAFRSSVCTNPESGPICWETYLFDEHVPWMGVPSEFLAKYQEVGIEALVSIGIRPGCFERSLVPDLSAETIPALEELDPEAAAVLYEYAFAVCFRCAKDFGVRTFMTVNEPEWAPRFFHMVDELASLKRLPIIRESDHGQTTAKGEAYRRCFGIQFAAMAKILRLAIDDVQDLLGVDLVLSGPTSNQFFSALAEYGAPYLDVLDFHHYSDHAGSHQARIDQARRVAQEYPEKGIAISEFNLKAGPTPYEKMLFVLPAALAQCDVLMTAIQAGTDGNPLDFLALYLFAGPSTHRSFKHLVYGDLNLLSWDGNDSALRSKGPEWYPVFEELQLRHTTPAYHIVKMLARAVTGQVCDGCEILSTNEDVHDRLRVLATRSGEELFVTVLDRKFEDVFADLADHQVDAAVDDSGAQAGGLELMLPDECVGKWAIVRRTSVGAHDEIVDVLALTTPSVKLEPCAQSVTQVRVLPHELSEITSLEIREEEGTPGSLADLSLHQTTRLRAAAVIDGENIDLSDISVRWESSAPHSVSVGPTGLVQRQRIGADPVIITATALPSRLRIELPIAPCEGNHKDA